MLMAGKRDKRDKLIRDIANTPQPACLHHSRGRRTIPDAKVSSADKAPCNRLDNNLAIHHALSLPRVQFDDIWRWMAYIL
jgi:hypothetical protein